MKSNLISLRGFKCKDCHYLLQRLRHNFCSFVLNQRIFGVVDILWHTVFFSLEKTSHPCQRTRADAKRKVRTRRPWIRNNLMSIVHIVSFVVLVLLLLLLLNLFQLLLLHIHLFACLIVFTKQYLIVLMIQNIPWYGDDEVMPKHKQTAPKIAFKFVIMISFLETGQMKYKNIIHQIALSSSSKSSCYFCISRVWYYSHMATELNQNTHTAKLNPNDVRISPFTHSIQPLFFFLPLFTLMR